MPIEKKLKDFVKIARWNDINYWSVKETVDKTHRTLFKFIKEYETSLKELVTPHLKIKSSTNGERQQNGQNSSINPKDFIFPNILEPLNDNSCIKSDLISRSDRYLIKAKKLCNSAILMSQYPGLRANLEGFIEEFVERSARLKALEIDQTAPKPKQKSLAKNILQQKKMALADYFKMLTYLGVSFRLGVLAWKTRKEEIFDFKIPPLNVESLMQNMSLQNADKKMKTQWEGSEKFFYQSLIKLNALNEAMTTNKTDLGPQNMERIRGFSAHLMIIANKQRKSLAENLGLFVVLKKQLEDLEDLNNDLLNSAQQDHLRSWAKDLNDLLILLRVSFEQFLIYLNSCPEESSAEAYSLCETEIPLENCSKNNETWKKAHGIVEECLRFVSNLSKKIDFGLITKKRFDLLLENQESLKKLKTKINDFALLFTSSRDFKHPLLETVSFLHGKIDDQISKFAEFDVIGSQNVISCNIEEDLEKLITMTLKEIENKYKAETDDNDDEIGKDADVEEEEDNDYEPNGLKEKLVEAVRNDVESLKLKNVHASLKQIVQNLFNSTKEDAKFNFT